METYILISVAVGISLGLLFIIKAVRSAEDDPETFEEFKNQGKFQKPANWKVGKLPETDEKKNAPRIHRIDFRPDYNLQNQN
ncbi:hypothetical protein [Cyclobacterium jeungdonense]|uniref:Uncharacterized protein n=1 Tax=Cyclobacterium jeungdonense TaxID=708087 RepID=A0ABT8CDX8_9BACT|nr:hypothetical protein [Cyclobacterium jeungdonense]MDN3690602.1 hypothetical protein [Cyclobacterium jeungdonense]